MNKSTLHFTDRKTLLQSLCREVGACFASEIDSDLVSPFKTEIPAIDRLSSGGFPKNTLSEIIESSPSSGGNILLYKLLEQVKQKRGYVALVDGNDSFAPDSVRDNETLRHLYWVRCRNTKEAIRVSDILAGDGNFSLLLIDLRRNDLNSLRRIPGNQWYRLQRAVQKSTCTCVALTPQILIPAAKLRLRLINSFDLSALGEDTTFLYDRLSAESLSDSAIERIG